MNDNPADSDAHHNPEYAPNGEGSLGPPGAPWFPGLRAVDSLPTSIRHLAQTCQLDIAVRASPYATEILAILPHASSFEVYESLLTALARDAAPAFAHAGPSYTGSLFADFVRHLRGRFPALEPRDMVQLLVFSGHALITVFATHLATRAANRRARPQ